MDLSIFETLESNVRGYIRSFPVVFTSSRGPFMWDEDGGEYIDFFSGAGTLNYGHNNPRFKDAVVEYIQSDSIAHGLDMATAAKRAFLETFKAKILEPRGLDYKLQFTGPTGANAVEAALKIARQATGRTNVVAFTHAFHGVSLGALAVTANAKFRNAAGEQLPGVSFVPYDRYFGDDVDTVAQLETLLDDPSSGLDFPAAVIVETVQGEGGVFAARIEWIRRLAKACQDRGILLIVDDIQIGCGRSGDFFSFEEAGITPDIVVLSKSLSGYGFPMSLVLMKRDLDVWKPGAHSGTFRGNNIAFVGAKRAIDEYWSNDELSKDVKRKAQIIVDRLTEIAHAYPGEFTVRGRGFLQGLVAAKDAGISNRVSHAAFERGLIVETSGAYDEVLKLMPPLIIDDETLEKGLGIIREAVDAVMAEGAKA